MNTIQELVINQQFNKLASYNDFMAWGRENKVPSTLGVAGLAGATVGGNVADHFFPVGQQATKSLKGGMLRNIARSLKPIGAGAGIGAGLGLSLVGLAMLKERQAKR